GIENDREYFESTKESAQFSKVQKELESLHTPKREQEIIPDSSQLAAALNASDAVGDSNGPSKEEMEKENLYVDQVEEVFEDESLYLDDEIQFREVKSQLEYLRVPEQEREKQMLELIKFGKTSSLVPIRTTVIGSEINALARLSVGRNDRGNIVLNLHFIRQNLSNDLEQPFMGHTFSDEQKKQLLSNQNAGEAIRITNSKGITKMVLVSVDRLTGELVMQPVENVLIPNVFRGVRLTEEDKLTLKSGQPLTIENVSGKHHTSYSVTVQYNADLEKVVSLPNSNKITIVGGSTLSQKESEDLRNGKTIQVSNMIDDKGEKYSAFVRIRYPKEEIVITPTNEHKVQVSHNNRGEKTEKNKRIEKKRGQSPVKSGTSQVKQTKRGIN
ncbi:MAG: DUF3945 domain-containing protein, partial [Bacteroides sp.]|uniref:DUF3945 domain-containing protein n=1 Tax=Bacteroides sp. TaxID=29523 RepID=UPI002FC610CB